jgi:hypothetical protein
MRPELFALYGGPDQIMGVTSGLATIAGLALMFWNKIVVFFGKIVNKVHPHAPVEKTPTIPPTKD